MVGEQHTAVLQLAYGNETAWGAHGVPWRLKMSPVSILVVSEAHLLWGLSLPAPSHTDSTVPPGPPHPGGADRSGEPPSCGWKSSSPYPGTSCLLLRWGAAGGENTESLEHKQWFRMGRLETCP